MRTTLTYPFLALLLPVLALAQPAVVPPYIYGVHDHDQLALRKMNEVGVQGWFTHFAYIGHDPWDFSHETYDWQNLGFGAIVRIDDSDGVGAGSGCTIPCDPADYPNFAQRCANFVEHSGGHIWVIGNEPNIERPFPTPDQFMDCFIMARNAIRSVPGHEGDWVAPGPPSIGHMDYWRAMVARMPGNVDFICIHTYAFAGSPQTINYDLLHWYRDCLDVLPGSLRHLPVFITEFGTGDFGSWCNAEYGLVAAMYEDINAWNLTPGTQKVWAATIYRWYDWDQWAMGPCPTAIQDFQDAAARRYRRDASGPTPTLTQPSSNPTHTATRHDATSTPTATPSATQTRTRTASPTLTRTTTVTPTPTRTQTASQTATPTRGTCLSDDYLDGCYYRGVDGNWGPWHEAGAEAPGYERATGFPFDADGVGSDVYQRFGWSGQFYTRGGTFRVYALEPNRPYTVSAFIRAISAPGGQWWIDAKVAPGLAGDFTSPPAGTRLLSRISSDSGDTADTGWRLAGGTVGTDASGVLTLWIDTGSFGAMGSMITALDWVTVVPAAMSPTPSPTPTAGPDRDGDGVPDALEGDPPLAWQGNLWLPDSDGDALLDGTEDRNRSGSQDPGETDMRDRDSDNDGLWDGMEALVLLTDPLDAASPPVYTDADGDNLIAGQDVNDTQPDIDGDRYTDGYEWLTVGLEGMGDPTNRPELGDANGDGVVSNLDALIVHSIFLGLSQAEAWRVRNCDLNRDGLVTNIDPLVLQTFSLVPDALLPVGP